MFRAVIIIFSALSLASCGGGSGGGAEPAPAPAPVPAPAPTSLSFSTDVEEIYMHNIVTLSWTSANASSCEASGDWEGSKELNGSEQLTLRDAREFTFNLKCISSYSNVEQALSVTVNSPYLYPDHWDETQTFFNKVQEQFKNPIGFHLEEIWFKSLTIPKSRFTSSLSDIVLEDPEFRSDVGYDTWINYKGSTYHLSCNWVPQKYGEGVAKIVEQEQGNFKNFYSYENEGCNHPLPLKNSDGSYQVVFPGHDEGKLAFAEVPFAPSYTFNLDTKEFVDMKLPLGSHGQAIFDYDLDGDDDFITNGFNLTDRERGNTELWNCGWGIFQNNGFNDFELIPLNIPDDVLNPNRQNGFIENEGCGGAMSADAYVEDGLLYVAYGDFNQNRNNADAKWLIERERNALVIYNANDLSINEVIQLPAPYVEESFVDLEYYEEAWIGSNGKSHDTHVQFMDIDYDGDKDILISNQSYWYEKTSVLQIIMNNEGVYVDETGERLFNWNIKSGGLHQWNFSDVNNDGYLDISTTDGCGGLGAASVEGIPRPWGCQKKVAVNDGTGHFLQIIGPMEIYQEVDNTGTDYTNEELTGSGLGAVFSLDADKRARWAWISPKDCNDGCYADGDWVLYITSIDSNLSTGPNGIDPALVGEPGFNEFYYLLHNESARKAVISGEYENGLEHYIAIGKAEGLLPNAKSISVIVVDTYDSNPQHSIN